MSPDPRATVPDPDADRESCLRFLLRFTSAPSSQARARAEVARVKQALKTYVKTQLPRVLLFAGIGFAISFLLNVYLMRGKYQGYQVPEGSPATGKGNVVKGSLYYLIGSTIVFALVGYRLKHGKHAFSKAVGRFPDRVKALVEADRRDLAVHLLWGLAGSLLVVLVLGPSVTGLIGIGIVVALGTVFRRLVTGLLMIGWRWTVARIAPKYAAPPSAPVTAVTSLAMLAAMLVGWIVHGTGARLVLAVAAGVGAYLVGQRRSVATTAAALLLLPVAFVTVFSLVPGTARADDGGEAECGGDFLGCPGADDLLLYSVLGGFAGAVGGAAGEAIGEATGEEDDDGGGGGGGKPPCGPEEAARTIEAWKNFQKANPGGTWDDFMGGKIAQSQAEAMALQQHLDEMSQEAQAIDDRLAAMEQSIKLANTPWKDMTPAQRQDVTKRVVAAYHKAHPGATADQINKMTGQFGQDPNLTGMDMLTYVAGESLLGLPGATVDAGKNTLGMVKDAPEFIKNVAASYWEDVQSGAAADRIGTVFVDPVAALADRIQTKGITGVMADAKASGMNLTAAGAKQFDQALRSFDTAVKTGDGKSIANAIDGVAGQMLSDYLLTAGAGKVVNMTRSGLEAAGLVKPLTKAEQIAAWSNEANGIPLDTPEKRAAVGFSEDASKAFQEAVDTHDATLQMQRRGADAVQHEGTAYMKPQGAKSMKSVGPMDAELGGPGKEGLLSFYKPVDPLAAPGSPIQKRYEMLQKLYDSVPGGDLAAKQSYITKDPLEVWVSGKKVKMDVKFDSEGVLRNVQDGKAIVSDYDGWTVLDKAGERRLGYDAAGNRLKGPELRADREQKIPLIRKLVDDGRTQLQHAPTSSEWGPIPSMLAGAEPTPCFDCKTLAIAENILANMAKDGAVEFRPGAANPYLTKAAGITDAKQPTLTLPGSKGAPAPAPAPKGPTVPLPRPTGGDGGNKK